MTTTILTHGRVTWTNIIHPTSEDIQQLSVRYPHFHPLNLADCKTELEFPKLDHHDEYLFLVAQIPIWEESEHLYRPTEVDIFIAYGTLVTSHQGDLEPLNQFFSQLEDNESLRAEQMGHGASPLLYHLLSAMVDSCFPIVHKVNHEIRHIEEHLFREQVTHVLTDITVVRRDIIALRRTLNPQLETIRALASGNWAFIHEDLDLYWSDISDHLAQLCSMLDSYAEIVAGLSDTIDTLASHRIDEVMRLLTVVTVMTLPLTLLATIFGMNIIMPYADHPRLFFTLLGAGFILTVATVWYLRRRRWL